MTPYPPPYDRQQPRPTQPEVLAAKKEGQNIAPEALAANKERLQQNTKPTGCRQ